MIKPCEPGATVTDRPPRPSSPPSVRPARFDPEVTLDEDSPRGANPEGEAREASTFLKLTPVESPPRRQPSAPRPMRRPRSVAAEPAALTSVERRRVVIVTAAMSAFAALVVWVAPTRRPPVAAPVERPAKRAEQARPKPAVTEPPAPAEDLRHEPLWLQVKLDDGTTERRAGGMLKLWSNPPADVSIVNGENFGRTPTQVLAPVGTVRLLFTNRELGLHKVVTLEVQPGLNGSHTMEFGRGWLDIAAPVGSKVAIDGRSIGSAPVAQQALFEGTHTVEVTRVNGRRASYQVEIVAGMTVTHEAPAALPP